jgi:hypothetical protein
MPYKLCKQQRVKRTYSYLAWTKSLKNNKNTTTAIFMLFERGCCVLLQFFLILKFLRRLKYSGKYYTVQWYWKYL